jgi:spore coat protein A
VYHLPLVIQDKQFNPDGTLFYETNGISPTHPNWVPEFFGDTPVVNGKAYPYLNAEPRRYRLRLLNGSQARFYNLHFNDGVRNLPFHVIGSEGGLLPAPVAKDSLLIAPGERFDVIVDFTGMSGKTVMVTNDANAPYPDGDPICEPAENGGVTCGSLAEILKIDVNLPLIGTDDTVAAALLKLPAVPRLAPTPGRPWRDVVAKETMVAGFEPGEEVPGGMLLNGYTFMDPVTDFIKAGTTETWQWINLTVDAHPMHPHLVASQVVDRQRFKVEEYTAAWQAYLDSARTTPKPDVSAYLIGDPIPPEPEEMGFKDTVKSPPGFVTRTRAQFTLPWTSLLDYNPKAKTFGDWVYHCHILEHEENDMMRPFRVVP